MPRGWSVRRVALVVLLGGCHAAAAGRPSGGPEPTTAPPGAPDAAPVTAPAPAIGDSAAGADSAAVRRPRLRIDPSTALRFEIVAVSDSTFSFLAAAAPWARTGTQGLAVDPRRRDVLVAAFDVLEQRADTVVALVTGQTARVTTDHVALLERPPVPPPPRRRSFRQGFGTGGAIGLVLGLVAGLLTR
jgi:hypothetical protein